MKGAFRTLLGTFFLLLAGCALMDGDPWIALPALGASGVFFLLAIISGHKVG